MAQTTILAAGTGAASSSNVVITATAPITVGLFTASGTIPPAVGLQVRNITPGAAGMVASLDINRPAITLTGPGTYRVDRPDISASNVAVGVYQDT